MTPTDLAAAAPAVMPDTRAVAWRAAGQVADRAVDQVATRAEVRMPGGGRCSAAELTALVGRDTARYVLSRARPRAVPTVDLAALAGSTDRNPAFRVRHAHARLCRYARQADALGVCPGPATALTHPCEREVHDLIGRRSGLDQPYRLVRHLEALTGAVERLEARLPVLPLGDDPVTDDHRARLALCAAVRGALADGLRRLDIDAPERL